MGPLNFHHLRYFHAVAHAETLTAAADRLNVSQSALSMQIRTLEERLGHPLFERSGRALHLTEVGRIALDHADRIFRLGDDLVATLARQEHAMPPLRVGAISTLSRNFQLRFLAPVLGGETRIVLRSGGEAALMKALIALDLDVVLTSAPPDLGEGSALSAHRLAAEPVGIQGPPEAVRAPSLRDLLAGGRFIVPSEAGIRTGFAALAQRLGVEPRIVADVDDMAMARLLVRDGAGLAVVPSVVVEGELTEGLLATAPFALDIEERFYAVTPQRSFPHPLLSGLLAGQGASMPHP